MTGSNRDFQKEAEERKNDVISEGRDDLLSKTPPLSARDIKLEERDDITLSGSRGSEERDSTASPEKRNWFLNMSGFVIRSKKRVGSAGSSQGKESPRKESPRKESPRKESPRKEVPIKSLLTEGSHSPRNVSPRSPRKDSRSSSPRLSSGSNSRSRSSSSSSPRLIYNPLPITEDEIDYCIVTANDYIQQQARAGFVGMSSSPGDSGGFYFNVQDSEGRYGVVVTRAPLGAGWKFYLIEKMHLLIDATNRFSLDKEGIEKSSLVGKGNEGRVVFAWDLSPSLINNKVVREKIVAKIYHLYSSDQAVLNEQLILEKLSWLYGRFDYKFNMIDEDVAKRMPSQLNAVNKKIIFMPLHPGKNGMDVLYKQDKEKTEVEQDRYLEKVTIAPIRKLLIAVEYVKAAHFLQEKGITHRDLKPDNALIDEEDRVCFIDFSSAMFTNKLTGRESPAGTFPYSAPETDRVARKYKQNFKVIDNYAIGIGLIEIFTIENFRRKVMGISQADAEKFFLSLEDIESIASDLFAKSKTHQELDVFLKKNHSDKSMDQIDEELQSLLYESVKESIVKIILALIQENPDDRMSLLDAENQLEKIRQEIAAQYENLKVILGEKNNSLKQQTYSSLSPMSSRI